MTAAPDSTRWQRVGALFREVLDRAPAERDAWLHDRCADDAELLAEVRGLLAAHAMPDAVLDSGGAHALIPGIVDGDDADRLIGAQVGPYRVVRLIGQGGMGCVYLAERSDGQFTHAVALKVVRGEFDDPSVRERFVRERQILARLQHPNIAPLHEGGVTPDGMPYFTLEYVDGVPLTRYCDEHALSIDARLRLMLKVCDAVAFAHRNLVVHRDLKPSNILVTAGGDVKLLDFGIAKLLERDDERGETATHARLMTREYAAPEQVLAQPITTATDVYALGVLVYELLCGRLPYARADSGEVSWPKAIVDDAPQPLSRALTRPSTPPTADAECVARARATPLRALRPRLRGDLDRIVARALEKSPESRYASVTSMARDIDAFLQGRALPGTTRRHRAAKFVRRNRIAVALSAALVASVVAAGAASIVQSRQTARAAEAALNEARTTAAVKDVLLGLFTAADPRVANGGEVTVRELLDRGAQRVQSNFDGSPALEAELQTTLGQIYFQLGLFAQAATLHEAAFETTKDVPALQRLASIAERELARTMTSRGDRANAAPHFEGALRRARGLVPRAPADEIDALYGLGMFRAQDVDTVQTERLGLEAVALARASDASPERLANAMRLLAAAYTIQHRYAESEALLRQALDLHTRALGEHHDSVGSDRHDLVLVLRTTGRYAEAIALLEGGLAAMQRAYGPDSVHVASQQLLLAAAYSSYGDYATAQPRLVRTIASLRTGEGRDGGLLPRALNMLGIVQSNLARYDIAEATFAESLRLAEARGTSGVRTATTVRSNLGELYQRTGRLEDAERALRDVLATEQSLGDTDFVWTWQRLGDVLRQRGDLPQALDFGKRARDQAIALHGERSMQAAWARYTYGEALAEAGDVAAAETELRGSLFAFAFIRADGRHPQSALTRVALAKLLLARTESHDEAVRLLHEAVSIREATFGRDHAATREARETLARAKNR